MSFCGFPDKSGHPRTSDTGWQGRSHDGRPAALERSVNLPPWAHPCGQIFPGASTCSKPLAASIPVGRKVRPCRVQTARVHRRRRVAAIPDLAGRKQGNTRVRQHWRAKAGYSRCSFYTSTEKGVSVMRPAVAGALRCEPVALAPRRLAFQIRRLPRHESGRAWPVSAACPATSAGCPKASRRVRRR